MRAPLEAEAAKEIVDALAELLNTPPPEVETRSADGSHGPDLVVRAVGATFVVEYKRSGSAAAIGPAIDQLRNYSKQIRKRTIPLLAVPFMGEVGRGLCERAGISWLDLSGNAHIMGPGLRIHVEGRQNRFKEAGRPSSVFAPKSSRIVRCLLVRADESLTQRELARATEMDEGFTSRIVRRLEKDDLLVRDPSGRVQARDPGRLLDAWREEYSFTKHVVLRGHIAARSGDALVRQLGDALAQRGIEYAATGLGAAWLITRFAGFRIATFYIPTRPRDALLADLGFRQDPRGANVWLAVPNDGGVFYGASKHDGVRCVHPVQVLLDLKDHPERAEEAASRLRADALSWRFRA